MISGKLDFNNLKAMNLQTKYLDKLKKDNSLAEFYTDNYDESYFGLVLNYTDEFLLIEKYDEDSNYNGLTILFRHNITRIRWSGNEIESVEKLIDSTKSQSYTSKIDLSSIHSVLESSYKLFNHITVHIQDIDRNICFIGQIHEIDPYSIVLHEYGTKTSLDRKFIFLSIDDITKIDVNGKYENNLLRLFAK